MTRVEGENTRLRHCARGASACEGEALAKREVGKLELATLLRGGESTYVMRVERTPGRVPTAKLAKLSPSLPTRSVVESRPGDCSFEMKNVMLLKVRGDATSINQALTSLSSF